FGSCAAGVVTKVGKVVSGFCTLIAAVSALSFTAQRAHAEGVFARSGQSPYAGDGLRPRDVPSPNGKSVVKIEGDRLESARLEVAGTSNAGAPAATPLEGIEVLPNPEILWSPEGYTFTVTASGQGVVGWWRTHLYVMDVAGKAQPRDLDSLVAPWYRTFAKCKYHENANFFAGAWLNGGKELLLVLAAPDHSNCANMGHFSGLRVYLPTWIVAEAIPEEELVERYGDKLGKWFKKVPERRTAEAAVKE
ncbi:MAG: hypothetical protein K2P94_18160, partial [Rhodospirillaceae bacterium]|nr:hypothetical protein [Rhodospirillaceae bacterium]